MVSGESLEAQPLALDTLRIFFPKKRLYKSIHHQLRRISHIICEQVSVFHYIYAVIIQCSYWWQSPKDLALHLVVAPIRAMN